MIGVLMITAALAAYALTPTQRMADLRGAVNLDTLVPRAFGDWRVDESLIPLRVSPEVQAQLDKVYDQTLARTYINSQGQRVMLSIAYGGDQTKALQLHRPEVCYAAQGFSVSKALAATLDVGKHEAAITVRRLVARLGQRTEPIMYWMRVGDNVVSGRLGQALARYEYGLNGLIPDGVLVRVSSISNDVNTAYAVQTQFIDDLSAALGQRSRDFFFGANHTSKM